MPKPRTTGRLKHARGIRVALLLVATVSAGMGGSALVRRRPSVDATAGAVAGAMSTPDVPRALPTFLPTVANAAASADHVPQGMVWIPGGEFSMGAQDSPDM